MVGSVNDKLGASKAFAAREHQSPIEAGQIRRSEGLSNTPETTAGPEKASFGGLAIKTDLTAETARLAAEEARNELSVSGLAIANTSSHSVLALMA